MMTNPEMKKTQIPSCPELGRVEIVQVLLGGLKHIYYLYSQSDFMFVA